MEITSLDRKIEELILPIDVFKLDAWKYFKSALEHSKVPSNVKFPCMEKIASDPLERMKMWIK